MTANDRKTKREAREPSQFAVEFLAITESRQFIFVRGLCFVAALARASYPSAEMAGGKTKLHI